MQYNVNINICKYNIHIIHMYTKPKGVKRMGYMSR